MTRSERRAERRALAARLRDAGIVPAGRAWDAAQAGETDPTTLAALNHADGLAAKRLPDGTTLPGGIRAGDYLPAYDAHAAGAGMVDPETGAVLVPLSTGRDVELPALEPVEIRRDRHAPAWVQEAAADYRHARDAWESARESGRPVPSTVPGAAGSAAAMCQLEPADYAAHVPAPRFADFLRDHAARRREDAAVPA
jgi:hypothetical protein